MFELHLKETNGFTVVVKLDEYSTEEAIQEAIDKQTDDTREHELVAIHYGYEELPPHTFEELQDEHLDCFVSPTLLVDYDNAYDNLDYGGNLTVDILEAGISLGIDIENVPEAYYGQYDTPEDLAYELVQDCYTLEGPLANYFDYKAFARDLMIGDYMEEDGYYFLQNY